MGSTLPAEYFTIEEKQQRGLCQPVQRIAAPNVLEMTVENIINALKKIDLQKVAAELKPKTPYGHHLVCRYNGPTPEEAYEITGTASVWLKKFMQDETVCLSFADTRCGGFNYALHPEISIYYDQRLIEQAKLYEERYNKIKKFL